MTQRPDITITRLDEAAVPAELHRQLITLLSTCFQGPNDASFRVQSYWRTPPTWRWIARLPDTTPVAQIAVHELTVESAAGKLRLGAVGDVCTHPDCRGQGLAKRLVAAAHEWLRTQGVMYTFLTGNPAVYSGSGYVAVNNPIRRFDPIKDAWVTGPVNNAMVCQLGDAVWPEGLIDWNGQLI